MEPYDPAMPVLPIADRPPPPPEPRRRRRRKAPSPTVKLGKLRRDGIAPSMFALLERGVERRPRVAARLRGTVAFRFAEDFAPVRVSFGARVIRVEDGDVREPDLAIEGRLPDIVHLAAAPAFRGVPNPGRRHGLAAIASVYRGQVNLVGDRRMARAVLQLLALS
jgi:hypothetical protein